MALADPITITIDGTAETFNCVSREGRRAEYRTGTGEFSLFLSHQEGKRRQTLVRITQNSIVEDPYMTGRSIPIASICSLKIDTELLVLEGSGAADQEKLLVGVFAWLQASTNAAMKKIIAGES